MEDGVWCASSPLGQVALQVLQKTLEDCGASSGTLALFDPYRKRLRIIAAFGLSPSRLRKSPYLPPQGVGAYVFAHRIPVLLDAVHAPPFSLPYVRLRDAASMCLPLGEDGGRAFGILSLNRRDGSFGLFPEEVAGRVIQKFSALLGKFQAMLEEEYALSVMEQASQILGRLDWAMGGKEVARKMFRLFRTLLPAEYAVLFVLLPLGKDVTIMSRKAARLLPLQMRKEVGRIFRPLFQERKLIVRDILSMPGMSSLLPPGIPPEVVVCPFVWCGHFLGAFVALVEVPPGKCSRKVLSTFGNVVGGILWGFASFERIRTRILEQERFSLARELHDRVAQVLSGASMYAEVLKDGLWRRGVLTESEAALFLKLERFLGLCASEVRSILGVLRGKEDREVSSLREALLERLDYLFGLQGVRYTVKLRLPEETLPAFVRREIFAILEECCTNVWKHAGATRLWVAARLFQGKVHLRVRDNGKGFLPGGEGKEGAFGLLGIRERVASLGGAVRIRSSPGKGTAIGVMFPVFW